jgi:phosphatidylserine/phosphatidylglycerophosphate/cardiolipin synthase-like enzyme
MLLALTGSADARSTAQASGQAASAPPVLAAQGTVQAAFAPWDDIEGIIIARLAGARHQVLMQAYLLTNRKIVDALVAAHGRGVDVKVMMDRGQLDKNSTDRLHQLRAAGIPVWFETLYRSAHNKVIVIDAGQPSAAVITGSFNFTWSAQHRNAENILVLAGDGALVARYVANWQRHREDAEVVQ